MPEDKGRLVTAFLEQFFRRYVEYDFTAALEEKLDLVSAGELDWKALLRDFWRDFNAAIGEIGELRMGQVIEALNEALGPHIFPDKGDGADPRACPTCGNGRLSLKTGRYGAFIGCSNYPECRYTRPIAAGERRGRGRPRAATASWASTRPPASTIWLKAGRFGPYVEEQGETPKRASLPKDWPPAAMDLDKAIRLLRLPREVGAHPDDGKPIVAGIGRYGPYVAARRHLRQSRRPSTRCSRWASTAPSPCWPRNGPAAAADAAAAMRRRWPSSAPIRPTASRCACWPAATVPTSSTAPPTPTSPAAPTPPR